MFGALITLKKSKNSLNLEKVCSGCSAHKRHAEKSVSLFLKGSVWPGLQEG